MDNLDQIVLYHQGVWSFPEFVYRRKRLKPYPQEVYTFIEARSEFDRDLKIEVVGMAALGIRTPIRVAHYSCLHTNILLHWMWLTERRSRGRRP
jgi:hypothetical protein